MGANSNARIERVVVAGGGLVGWSAAAALKRRLPYLSVTLVDLPPPPEALADRGCATLPSITGFHHDLGLTEADTVLRAGSSFRLGTSFEGWAAGRPAYVHAYGPHGHPFGATSFHLHWIRAAAAGTVAPFDAHSAAAQAARAQRFAHPQAAAAAPESGFEYGLFIDPARYRSLLRAFARHVGVEEQPGPINRVEVRADGFVEALTLAGDRRLTGDLFIDCTGPEALIRSAIDATFEPWDQWFPCDRILLAEGAPPPELPVLDRARAVRAGWAWQMASPARTSAGLVYASSELDDGEAAAVLGETGTGRPLELLSIRPGHRPLPWLRNSIVLGDAAVAIEPLEWTNLHLAHSAIDRIVAMMPGRDCAAIELAEYNRQVTAEAERVRDFLLVHYLCADRPDESFWRARQESTPPASLAHTLNLFRERGRLPYYEEETFSRDSWLAVLLGQGVLPRRIDPLTDSVDPNAAATAMAQMRAAAAAVAGTLPSHSAYLHNLQMRARTRS
jgi:tryptophan 7-halogenase